MVVQSCVHVSETWTLDRSWLNRMTTLPNLSKTLHLKTKLKNENSHKTYNSKPWQLPASVGLPVQGSPALLGSIKGPGLWSRERGFDP